MPQLGFDRTIETIGSPAITKTPRRVTKSAGGDSILDFRVKEGRNWFYCIAFNSLGHIATR